MGQHDDMLAAIGAIYAAACGTIEWQAALDRMLSITGFDGAALWMLPRMADPAVGRTVWHRLDPAILDEYVNHYVSLDPRAKLLKNPEKNRVGFDYKSLTEPEIDRNAYYAWYEPASGMRYHVGGVGRPDLPFFAGVTLHRPRRRGHADEAEIERFSLLFDHLERALELAYRLSVDRGIAANLAELTFTETTACIFLDTARRPVFANQLAREIADRRYLILTASEVLALHPDDNRQLQSLISQCIETATGSGTKPGGSMQLRKRLDGSELMAIVSPLRLDRAAALGPLGPAVCIMVVDPTREHVVDESMLRQLFRLSPAEAAITAQLCGGATLQQVANARAIGIGTARSYLEQAFHKTGTNRQSQLIRLILSLPRVRR